MIDIESCSFVWYRKDTTLERIFKDYKNPKILNVETGEYGAEGREYTVWFQYDKD